MEELPHSKSCFVCGSQNRSGLNLRFQTDGSIVTTRFVPRPEHNGFFNVTHGGLLATLLDEVMVWACAVRVQKFSYCAEMTVRYLSPATPGMEILASGELIENKKDRLYFAKGELKSASGVALATSTGKYMPIRNLPFEELLADFEGTPEQLRRFLPSTRS